MLHEPVMQQLAKLGLRGAADALARLPFNEDVFEALALLLDAESLLRDSTAQARRLRLARLGQIAHPADVDLRTPRGLGKARWNQLLSLNWLQQHRHLLLVGPTGVGKSYLACALAKAVIEHKRSVRYLRLPRLGDELASLQAQSRTSHWLKTLSRIDLVILDDFGLVPLSPSLQPLLLELLEDRHQRGSLLLTSQLPLKLWHAQFHDPTLADAILDRLVHGAELVELKGESMRKRAQAAPPAEDSDNQKP